MAKDDEPGILPASEDAYGGVIVDKECLPSSSDLFEKSLAMSLKHWREYGFRGVWLKIPLAQAALVPAAVNLGFVYHHAEPDYLMLNHWLPESPSTLPPNASHQVGVGGFVLNEKHEVLVVQEMNGPLRGQGVWKMPTGLVSVGEDLHLAAVREVKEETGVDAQFEAVLATRQSHGMAFGKSDLFFVCALRAASDQTLRPCDTEISDARWMPLDEFCDIEFMKGRELYAEVRSGGSDLAQFSGHVKVGQTGLTLAFAVPSSRLASGLPGKTSSYLAPTNSQSSMQATIAPPHAVGSTPSVEVRGKGVDDLGYPVLNRSNLG